MKNSKIKLSPIIGLLLLFSCVDTDDYTKSGKVENPSAENSKINDYYLANVQDSLASKSTGSVSNGKLINGTLLPFKGANYEYFDTTSYLEGRGFSHRKVASTIEDSYAALEDENRRFFLMECSNKKGGKIFPHRTHQNGLSADFMMPLLKQRAPYYELDRLGSSHYLLEFNDDGQWQKDTSVIIDFDLVAKHILELDKSARKHGLYIKKVIINTDLKDELYSTVAGKKLKSSSIYVVKSLTPLINMIHDDHYHVDFGFL